MKKLLKQILAASLVMMTLLEFGVMPYAKAEEKEVKGNAESEIALLTNLGFVDDNNGPKESDDLVTRAQFASIFAYVRGFDKETVNSGSKFIDISDSFWCGSQIYALNDVGLINGTEANLFSPNEYITYPQVVKCLVSLLGYDMQAGQLGGYPNGYLAIASQIGLVADASFDEPVDFGTVAKLVTTAMDTELMELQINGDGSLTFSKSKYQTPLKEFNDIYYDTGIMTDNGYTTLTGASKTSEDSVVIKNTEIQKGDCKVDNYLGYRLKYYYKTVDSVSTLIFVEPYKNEVVTIKDDELDLEQSDFSIQRIYHNNGRGKSYYKIDEYVDVIYNGKAYPEFSVDDLKIDQGTLDLIDNDQDGYYEVIFINEYYNIYVAGIDTSSETIFDQFGKKVEYGEFDVAEFYSTDGSRSSATAINSKQVISVFESKDAKMCKLVFSAGAVSGKVTSVDNPITKPTSQSEDIINKFKKDAKDMSIIVADKEYKLSTDFVNATLKGYQSTNIPQLGLTYSFHFDMYGKIVAVDAPTGKQYAYLVRVAYIDDGSEMSGMTMCRIFLQDGTLMSTVFAKNVKVNGTTYKGQSDGQNAVFHCPLFYDSTTGAFIRQPAKVTLNNLGEITEVETAYGVKDDHYGYNPKNEFTEIVSYDGEGYGGHGQRRFKDYMLANDVVIFNVPPATDFDEDELAVITESSLTEGSTYPVTLYDADATWACKFAIIQAGESEDYSLSLFIVESTGEALLADGTVGKFVRGNFGGMSNYVLYENKAGVFPEVQPGDICRAVEGLNNKALALQVIISPKKQGTSSKKVTFHDPDWINYWARLYARSDVAFSLITDDDEIIAMPFNGTSFYVLDMEDTTVRSGSISDMVMNCPIQEDGTIDLTNADSMILAYKRRGYARTILVVKNIK